MPPVYAHQAHSFPPAVRGQLNGKDTHHHHHHQHHLHTSNPPHNATLPSPTSSPMLVLKHLTIFFLSLFSIFGAIITILILYVTIRPFSLPTYRRLSCTLGVGSFLDAMSLLLPNMRIYLTGDSDPLTPVGVSVLVCNHSMDGDWWAMLMLARCVGLRGSIKAFLQQRSSGGGNNGSPQSSLHQHEVPSMPALINPSASAPTLQTTANHEFTGGMTRNRSHHGVTFSSSTSPTGSPKSSAHGTSTNNSKSTAEIGLAKKFLKKILDFPLLSSENNQNYIQDRNELFSLLRSFASNSSKAPTHLLLFPEGWPNDQDRRSMIAKSVEFAKREGRPQLKNLLLPRTTGFYASLDSLREASPVVYDVTMAYRGYDAQTSFPCDVSLLTLFRLIQGKVPDEVHIRVKRFSMEEVLSDPNWLDKQWAEKDRMLGHFQRHGNFPVDNRGFCRHNIMDTKSYSMESSLTGLIRLGVTPFTIPIILLLAVPLLFCVGWIWLAYQSFLLLFPGGFGDLSGTGGMHGGRSSDGKGGSIGTSNGGTDSAVGTPFFPATPFASPTHLASWTSSKDDSPKKRR